MKQHLPHFDLTKTSLFKPLAYASLVFLAIALTGCVGQPKLVGDTYGETPPRLVQSGEVVHWNRTLVFGPVPQDLQAKGDSVCQSIGATRAIGYHPLAEDLQAKPIQGGGYFCEIVR